MAANDFLEVPDSAQQHHCLYLEPTHTSFEDNVEFSDPSFLPGAQTHHFICGHTGRANGPDCRPATDHDCRPGRPCFHPRNG